MAILKTMIVENYIWDEVLPTGYCVNRIILKDINQFKRLIEHLELNDYEFVQLFPEGIVIKSAKRFESISYRFQSIEFNLENLENRFDDLIKNKKIEKEVKDITQEFYLMAELLNEDVRNNIKIYKK